MRLTQWQSEVLSFVKVCWGLALAAALLLIPIIVRCSHPVA